MHARHYHKAFTLIELVVVIVIIAIISIVAAPRFLNLGRDAHIATLKSLKAQFESQNAIVYGQSVLASVEDSISASIDINHDGQTDANVRFGYMPEQWEDGIEPIMALSACSKSQADSNDAECEGKNWVYSGMTGIQFITFTPMNIYKKRTDKRCVFIYQQADPTFREPIYMISDDAC
jgi:MSHA pilin protein MshA